METHHQPQFIYKPESPLYGRRVELPCYVIEGPAMKKYDRGGAEREELLARVRRQLATELRAPGRQHVKSVTVYDRIGNVLYVWTREDIGA